MKKVFALGLMVVCLGMFSLGCPESGSAPKPAPPVAAPDAGTTEGAPADAEKPADAAPADAEKPAEAEKKAE